MIKTVGGDAIRDLLEAARGQVSAAALERVKQLGVPVEGKLAAAYPVELWATCVRVVAEDVFAGVDEVEAQRRLGGARIDVAAKTWKGRVLFACRGGCRRTRRSNGS